MAKRMTSIRLDTQLADEAAKVLGVKSRTEAVHIALREIVALEKFFAHGCVAFVKTEDERGKR